MSLTLLFFWLLLLIAAVAIVVVKFVVPALNRPQPQPPGSPPPPIPPGNPPPQPLKLGHYGVLTTFNDNGASTLLKNVNDMLEIGVTDFQFFDWAANYSGVFQAFQRGPWNPDPGSIATEPGWWTAKPDWWTREKGGQWTDTYSGYFPVDRAALVQGIQTIKDQQGRAWAYVNSQTSEFLNLAGTWKTCNHTPDEAYGNPRTNDPQTISASPGSNIPYPSLFPFFGDADKEEQQLCKWVSGAQWKEDGSWNGGGVWSCQEGGHELPGYRLNGPLARYQCNAWVPILLDLGFSGVHWDIFFIGNGGPQEASGVAEFLRVAGELLQSKGLLQTFNNCWSVYDWRMMSFGVGQSMLFPYAETWNQSAFDSLANISAMCPGCVAARYTGGKPYIDDQACCATTTNPPGTTETTILFKCFDTKPGEAFDCVADSTLCSGKGGTFQKIGAPGQPSEPSGYENCPVSDGTRMTQAQLSAKFWTESCAKGVRLLILADGLRQIQQDYFRDNYPISSELRTAITSVTCGTSQTLSSPLRPFEDAFNGQQGLFMHATTWSWAKNLPDPATKTAADVVIEQAYSAWHNSLPLTLYRFGQAFSGDDCPSLAIAFDGNKLQEFVLCTSAVDRDSLSRSCCACLEDVPWCHETGDKYYELSAWQPTPHWDSPYCPKNPLNPTTSCDSLSSTAPGFDAKACKMSYSGCGANIMELEDVGCTIDSVKAGTCQPCYTLLGDKYGDDYKGDKNDLIAEGLKKFSQQSIYDGKAWDTFMQRTHAANAAIKERISPSAPPSTSSALRDAVPAFENEISIYVNPAESDYHVFQKAMTDALVAVMYLPQDCDSDAKKANAQKVSWQAAATLSALLKRPVPCLTVDYEKMLMVDGKPQADLSMWDPDSTITNLQAPPYNLRIETLRPSLSASNGSRGKVSISWTRSLVGRQSLFSL